MPKLLELPAHLFRIRHRFLGHDACGFEEMIATEIVTGDRDGMGPHRTIEYGGRKHVAMILTKSYGPDRRVELVHQGFVFDCALCSGGTVGDPGHLARRTQAGESIVERTFDGAVQ